MFDYPEWNTDLPTNKIILESEDLIFLPKCVSTVCVHKVPLFKHNRLKQSVHLTVTFIKEQVLQEQQGGSKITAVFTNSLCAVKHVKREVLALAIYVWRCACLHQFKVDSANSFAQMLLFYVHPFNMFLLWCLVISGFMQQFLSCKTVFSFRETIKSPQP